MSRVDIWFATMTYASSGSMFSKPNVQCRIQGQGIVWASMCLIFSRPGGMRLHRILGSDASQEVDAAKHMTARCLVWISIWRCKIIMFCGDATLSHL